MKIYRKILSIILTSLIVLVPEYGFAEIRHFPIIDIYGTKQITVAEINKKVSKEDWQKLADLTYKMVDEAREPIEKKITNIINKMGDFAYLRLTPMTYSDKENIYITINAVDKKDAKRLTDFLPEPKGSFPDPDNLIALMNQYTESIFKDFRNIKQEDTDFVCPSFHCLEGEKLKAYQDTFINKVPGNKDKLIKILREDKNEDKRAAAAYLLSYIKDGDELLKILEPSMKDSSYGVRNNAMRVIGYALMTKLKSANFPIQKAIDAINYPTGLDRNKALFILVGLAGQTRYAIYIKEHAKSQLITLLKMKQPNIHDTVYVILQIISGKRYGDRNYTAWAKWLNS